jgi:hypothetical protein
MLWSSTYSCSTAVSSDVAGSGNKFHSAGSSILKLAFNFPGCLYEFFPFDFTELNGMK